MALIRTQCAICGAEEDYKVLYKQNFDENHFSLDTFSARKLPDRIHYQMVRCDRDGLVRSNPVLDQESLEKVYKDSKFIYEEETDNLTDTYLRALGRALPRLTKEAKMLEIGCGNGFILKALYGMGYQNVFGVEPSREAVEKADQTITEHIASDMLREGLFPPNTFDLIFFFQTFEHIAQPNSFLRMCRNLLKPGGLILAYSHNVESLQARVLRERSPIIDIGHTYLYSMKTIGKIFEKNHFEPIEVYSPANTVTLSYLLWLAPIPSGMKQRMMKAKGTWLGRLLNTRMKVKLGNLCITAKKI